jgi:hypothetical protein
MGESCCCEADKDFRKVFLLKKFHEQMARPILWRAMPKEIGKYYGINSPERNRQSLRSILVSNELDNIPKITKKNK